MIDLLCFVAIELAAVIAGLLAAQGLVRLLIRNH